MPPTLTADEFARRFEESASVLWTIAAGVLGNRSHVDDVLQEAAVIALGKLDRFDAATSFTAWVGRVVRYVALNQLRRGHRRRALPLEAAGSVEGRGASDAAVELPGLSAADLGEDHGAFDDRLTSALAELRPIARACLLLRVVQGLEYREISRALSIPEGTAMSHVHRSRQALRRRLEEAASAAVAAPAVPAATKGAHP